MTRLQAILVAAAMIAVTVPTTSAETVTTPYAGSAGVRALGIGFSAVVCPSGCDVNDDGTEELDPIGGARLRASTDYRNVVVSLQDDVYGASAGILACFWNPGGDSICDGDDYQSEWVCGTVSLLGSPYAADEVTVWAVTVLVSDAFEVCGATRGTINADFF